MCYCMNWPEGMRKGPCQLNIIVSLLWQGISTSFVPSLGPESSATIVTQLSASEPKEIHNIVFINLIHKKGDCQKFYIYIVLCFMCKQKHHKSVYG